jgi:hypothetical protein
MPRPPLPTAIHEAKGSYIHDPQRRREAEPQPKGAIGEPPQELGEAEKRVWYELLEVLPDGVVTSECRYPFAYLATLIVKQLRGDLAAWEAGQLRSYFAGFGMTPADRVKVHVQPQKPKDEWDELDAPPH